MITVKTHSTRIIVAALLGMAATYAGAQPDWAVVPTDFEFTMTVTSLAKIDCVESLDTNDIVAAFVGNEVRGVQRFREYFNGHNFSFMVVYDNTFNGNELHFKLYDASTNTIHDALEKITFYENGHAGSSDEPFVFHTSPGIDEVAVAGDSIAADMMAFEVVSTLTALNESNMPAEVVYTFVDDEKGTDNHYLAIYGNKLLLNADATEIDKEILDLHVLATPVSGCVLDYSFQLFKVGSSTVAVESTMSDEKSTIMVFPNPANGVIHWDEDIDVEEVRVYDMQGKLMERSLAMTGSSFDLSFLAPGPYVLRLKSDVSVASTIIVKE